MFIFASLCLCDFSYSPSINDSFIRTVCDNVWNDQRRKAKNAFLFFHTPYDRTSDTGYLRFVHVARRYQDKAQFFVIPGYCGEATARRMRINGFPSLYHISLYDNIEMIGPMSSTNINDFILNFTTEGYKDLNLSENTTNEDLIKLAFRDEFESDSTGFIFADEESKLGRALTQYANKHATEMRFLRIQNKELIESLGYKFPSFLYFRIDDHKNYTYTGEGKIEEIEKWFKDIRRPNYFEFRPDVLFLSDGSITRSVIDLIPREKWIGSSDVFESIQEIFDRGNHNYAYADPTEIVALRKYIGAPDNSTRLCIATNVTWIGGKDCSGLNSEQFFDTKFDFKRTPKELFGGVATLSSLSFSDLTREGPLYVGFTRTDTPNGESFQYHLHLAAAALEGLANTTFGIWKMERTKPPFAKRLGLQWPSLYFFPDGSLEGAERYEGSKTSAEQIMKWVLDVEEKRKPTPTPTPEPTAAPIEKEEVPFVVPTNPPYF